MSEIRRKLLMDLESTLPDYIQDGLIFELDGLDKSPIGDYVWVDKVGGIGFKNAGSVIEIPNGFTFNGTTNSILNSTTVVQNLNDPSNYTIEVVIYSRIPNRKWAPVVMFNGWTWNCLGVAIGLHNGPYPWIKYSNRQTDGRNRNYLFLNNRLSTISLLALSPIYENKLKITEYATSDPLTASNDSCARVGGRISGSNKLTFTGDIHAIRLYNRRLSESEILYNQQIDILKYNIPI